MPEDGHKEEIEVTDAMLEAATDYAFGTGYLPEPTEENVREILTSAYRLMHALQPAKL